MHFVFDWIYGTGMVVRCVQGCYTELKDGLCCGAVQDVVRNRNE